MAYRENWGGKTGSGGAASEDALGRARQARVRELTQASVDFANDPYVLRNHLGALECRLCLTTHANEGNYLAHSQGRRHQENLARRAARDARDTRVQPSIQKQTLRDDRLRKSAPARIKIGRPGYKLTKQRDPYAHQNSLLVQVLYPEIASLVQPRFRFMSAYEQRKERPDSRYQYFLIAAEPYETIAFKIPNLEIDRAEHKFFSNWDRDKKVFTVQMFFKPKPRPSQGIDPVSS
ncbi:Splicing factor 3A subunit 2 [Porphyridium purpureum]|uniref:Splicing factor 3A subunit 2 n=1 Tax=Porphyridium purpureum TaxID=35688 RepID=A0A5J4YQ80_PORPP|nr:Splicing factor 3A subunit 2 [Porphyridium purpureum]|eukprot:POR6611..scf296_7